MAAVSEARPALSEKLGIDFVIKQLNDPDTEIVAAAATLLGNLAHQDGAHPHTLVTRMSHSPIRPQTSSARRCSTSRASRR